jgi:anti-sigma-K factor RskA
MSDGPRQPDRIAVAEYVLGLLGPQEHAAVAAAIARDPKLAAEEAFWQSRLEHFDSEFAESQPPASALKGIEQRLGLAETAPSGFGALWNNLGLWRAATAGAFAVAAIAVGVAMMPPAAPTVDTIATQLVAALEEEGSDVRFIALYDSETGAVRLTGLSGEAGPDRDFELWAIQGGDPISMGVIPAAARSEVPLSDVVMEGWGEGSVLAITLEPQGGSPTGGPTGPLVAQGAVTPI